MSYGNTAIFLLFIFSWSLPSPAQFNTGYSFQQDDKNLKHNYYEQSAKKKTSFLGNVQKEYAADYKKIYEEQFKEIASLWQSDRSVTSPVEHQYLQSIVEKIIIVNPELKNTDARIIFSRDYWPNAYSMGDGTIAINAGLLVFLDNEAELVFVLCHELAHYYLQHTPLAIRKYVETVNSESFQKELKRIAKTEFGVNRQLEQLAKSFAFRSRQHSRENEAAADRMAFSFMKKTGYDCGAIKSSLELLDKVDDSLIYKPLDLQQVFNFPAYPFKKKWIQKQSSIFSQLDESKTIDTQKERDSLKTHPDCAKRIALLSDSLAAHTGGQKFLINETLFKKLKKDFFCEMAEQCYRDKNLSRNLYYSLLLLQSPENNGLAAYSVARGLNTLYENQKAHKLGSTIDTENKAYREEYNVLLRMLDQLRLDEIASLSYHFCSQYALQMKNDKGFEAEMRKAQNFIK